MFVRCISSQRIASASVWKARHARAHRASATLRTKSSWVVYLNETFGDRCPNTSPTSSRGILGCADELACNGCAWCMNSYAQTLGVGGQPCRANQPPRWLRWRRHGASRSRSRAAARKSRTVAIITSSSSLQCHSVVVNHDVSSLASFVCLIPARPTDTGGLLLFYALGVLHLSSKLGLGKGS